MHHDLCDDVDRYHVVRGTMVCRWTKEVQTDGNGRYEANETSMDLDLSCDKGVTYKRRIAKISKTLIRLCACMFKFQIRSNENSHSRTSMASPADSTTSHLTNFAKSAHFKKVVLETKCIPKSHSCATVLIVLGV